jgi:hypothetical protein
MEKALHSMIYMIWEFKRTGWNMILRNEGKGATTLDNGSSPLPMASYVIILK